MEEERSRRFRAGNFSLSTVANQKMETGLLEVSRGENNGGKGKEQWGRGMSMAAERTCGRGKTKIERGQHKSGDLEKKKVEGRSGETDRCQELDSVKNERGNRGDCWRKITKI